MTCAVDDPLPLLRRMSAASLMYGGGGHRDAGNDGDPMGNLGNHHTIYMDNRRASLHYLSYLDSPFGF